MPLTWGSFLFIVATNVTFQDLIFIPHVTCWLLTNFVITINYIVCC